MLNSHIVTNEEVKNLPLGDLLERTNKDILVLTPDQLDTVLWYGVKMDDTSTFRDRIDAWMKLVPYIGITDKGKIFIYTGTDVKEFITTITEKDWAWFTWTEIATFQMHKVLLTKFRTNKKLLTEVQIEATTYFWRTVTTGMVGLPITTWLTHETNVENHRHTYMYCDGETKLADLPKGVKNVKAVIDYRLLEQGDDRVRVKTDTGDVFDGTVIYPGLNVKFKPVDASAGN